MGLGLWVSKSVESCADPAPPQALPHIRPGDLPDAGVTCSPPTARPCTSLHEQGLAIDFTCNGGVTVSHGAECWDWLVAHAGDGGLCDQPSESWHWSPTGG
jgi:hypothetical protein